MSVESKVGKNFLEVGTDFKKLAVDCLKLPLTYAQSLHKEWGWKFFPMTAILTALPIIAFIEAPFTAAGVASSLALGITGLLFADMYNPNIKKNNKMI